MLRITCCAVRRLPCRVQGGELCGTNVSVSTGHGAVDIRRVVAQRLALQTTNAAVTLGALYMDKGSIITSESLNGLGRQLLTTGWHGFEAKLQLWSAYSSAPRHHAYGPW